VGPSANGPLAVIGAPSRAGTDAPPLLAPRPRPEPRPRGAIAAPFADDSASSCNSESHQDIYSIARDDADLGSFTTMKLGVRDNSRGGRCQTHSVFFRRNASVGVNFILVCPPGVTSDCLRARLGMPLAGETGRSPVLDIFDEG
jgi:hypothetical protein